MSQNYQELQGTDTIAASRTVINNNIDALKTNFSGIEPPFEASATTLGATYYNTTERKNYQVVQSGSSYAWSIPPENVHTSGDESIAGSKTFTSDITAPNITSMATTLSNLSSSAAHLGGTETFTGNKTFSGSVSLGSNATAETKTAATNTTAVATTAHVKLLLPVSVGSGVKPVYTNASGIITASSSTVGSASQPVYMNSGEITAITGAIANNTTGNAATATALATTRTINGTGFDGTSNITTTKWGTARNISIADADGTNTGTATSVNGSGAVTLKLPETIKASIAGNAYSATKATQDASGNVITSTYATKAGNNAFTGTNTFVTQQNSDNSQKAATTEYVHNILDSLYPVGSIYIGTQTTCPLATLISGSTWTIVAKDRALWGGSGSNANTTISAGLPNITGKIGYVTGEALQSGAFYKQTSGRSGTWDTYWDDKGNVLFDASRSNSIYGSSTTVQPPAYRVNVWRRTA